MFRMWHSSAISHLHRKPAIDGSAPSPVIASMMREKGRVSSRWKDASVHGAGKASRSISMIRGRSRAVASRMWIGISIKLDCIVGVAMLPVLRPRGSGGVLKLRRVGLENDNLEHLVANPMLEPADRLAELYSSREVGRERR